MEGSGGKMEGKVEGSEWKMEVKYRKWRKDGRGKDEGEKEEEITSGKWRKNKGKVEIKK